MVTRDTPWPDGTPCWVDLGTSDIPKAIGFYSSQFGWDIEQGGPEVGGYSMAKLDGRNVGRHRPDHGPARHADRLDHLLRVERRGRHRGQDHQRRRPDPQRPDGRHGRRAGCVVAADVTGAVFGVWQGRNHTGARGRQRARRVHLERAHEPRLRGRQGVLRGGLRLRVRRHVERRVQLRHLLINGQQVVGGIGAFPAGSRATTHPAFWSVLLRHLGHRQGRGPPPATAAG